MQLERFALRSPEVREILHGSANVDGSDGWCLDQLQFELVRRRQACRDHQPDAWDVCEICIGLGYRTDQEGCRSL